MQTKKNTVSLVLSSGGARGAAQIGVIETLEEHGYKIKNVSGSSIGAAVGGCYAAGHLSAYKNWLTSLDQFDVFKLMDFTISKQGMIKGERVFNVLQELIGDPLIEDLDIHYTATATDLRARQEVWFQQGKLLEAIRASVSIPSVIMPYYLQGRELVDGGVLNPLPIAPAQQVPADFLVVVNLNANIPYHPPQHYNVHQKEEATRINTLFNKFADRWQLFTNQRPKSNEETFSHLNLLTSSFNIMNMKVTELLLEKTQPDMIIPISVEACSTMEFYRSAEMIEAGKEAAEKAIQEFQSQRSRAAKNQKKG